MVIAGEIMPSIRKTGKYEVPNRRTGKYEIPGEPGMDAKALLYAAIDKLVEERSKVKVLESVRDDCAPRQPYGMISERTGLPMQQLIRAYWRSARRCIEPPPWIQAALFGTME